MGFFLRSRTVTLVSTSSTLLTTLATTAPPSSSLAYARNQLDGNRSQPGLNNCRWASPLPVS